MVKKLTSNKKIIKLTCTNCQITVPVITINPDIYTQDVKDKYKCLSCSWKRTKK